MTTGRRRRRSWPNSAGGSGCEGGEEEGQKQHQQEQQQQRSGSRRAGSSGLSNASPTTSSPANEGAPLPPPPLSPPASTCSQVPGWISSSSQALARKRTCRHLEVGELAEGRRIKLVFREREFGMPSRRKWSLTLFAHKIPFVFFFENTSSLSSRARSRFFICSLPRTRGLALVLCCFDSLHPEDALCLIRREERREGLVLLRRNRKNQPSHRRSIDRPSLARVEGVDSAPLPNLF